MGKIVQIVFIFGLFFNHAQGESPKISLNLEDLPQLIYKENKEVQIAKKNILLAQYEEVAANSPFDWNLYTSAAQEKKITNPNSAFDQGRIKEETSSLSLGTTRDFYYGTKIDLSFQLLHIQSDSLVAITPKRYQGAAKLKIDQPLLNGFGPQNIAEKLLKAKPKINRYQAEFISTFSQKLKNAVDLFWEIIAKEEEINLQFKSIKKLIFMQNYATKANLAGQKGKMEMIEVHASLVRDQALLEKKQGEKFQSILKLLALIDYPQDKIFSNIDQNIFFHFDSDSLLKTHLNISEKDYLSSDHKKEEFQLEELMVDLKQKKNRLMPKLDLQIELTSPSLSRSISDSLSQVSKNEFNNFKISLNFVWAIENLQAKGEHIKAYESYNQQELKITNKNLSDSKLLLQKKEELKISETNESSLIERKEIGQKTIDIAKEMMINGNMAMPEYLEELENLNLTEQELIEQLFKKRKLRNQINQLSGRYDDLYPNV